MVIETIAWLPFYEKKIAHCHDILYQDNFIICNTVTIFFALDLFYNFLLPSIYYYMDTPGQSGKNLADQQLLIYWKMSTYQNEYTGWAKKKVTHFYFGIPVSL
jgi:hypothetical protein